MEFATPIGLRPADFPIGSPRSRAVARQLVEELERVARGNRPQLSVEFDDLGRAKEFARSVRDRDPMRPGPGSLAPEVWLIRGTERQKIPY